MRAHTRDGQNRESETGGEKANHAQPPQAPKDEKPHEAGTAKPDGSATKHGTPQPAAKASDAHEPEPAPQKQEDEEEEGATPTGHAPDGKEKSGALTPPSARTNATERAANEPRDGTPDAPTNDAMENTRKRDDGRAARTAASTPEAHPTNTRDDGASAAKHGARQAGATEREPENPTTDAPDKAATTEEGKGDDMATTGTDPNPRPGLQAAPCGEHACARRRRGAALGWRGLPRAGGVTVGSLRPEGATRAKPNCAHGPASRQNSGTASARVPARRPESARHERRASARAGADEPQLPVKMQSKPPRRDAGWNALRVELSRVPSGACCSRVEVALMLTKQVRARSGEGGWKWARAGNSMLVRLSPRPDLVANKKNKRKKNLCRMQLKHGAPQSGRDANRSEERAQGTAQGGTTEAVSRRVSAMSAHTPRHEQEQEEQEEPHSPTSGTRQRESARLWKCNALCHLKKEHRRQVAAPLRPSRLSPPVPFLLAFVPLLLWAGRRIAARPPRPVQPPSLRLWDSRTPERA